MSRHVLVLALLACLGGTSAPSAGPVLLTVEAGGREIGYDRAALEALGTDSFATSTIWTYGVNEFTGPPLATLLADAGITGGSILAIAINDYAISMPVAEIQPDAQGRGPVVAFLLDGAPMSVRDKGPLWLVWPYDADSAFRTDVTFARSVWQLHRIRQLPDGR